MADNEDNPLAGLGDMAGQALQGVGQAVGGLAQGAGSVIGGAIGGVGEVAKGVGKGVDNALAPIVQMLFGHDPFAAESWHKAVEPPPPSASSPLNPSANVGGINKPAPPRLGDNPGELRPVQITSSFNDVQQAFAASGDAGAPGIQTSQGVKPEDLDPQQTDGSPEANAVETARLDAARAKAAGITPDAPPAKYGGAVDLMLRFNKPVYGPNNMPPSQADAEVSKSNTPGLVKAVTTDQVRTFDANGYGNMLKGAISVNGHTYNFVSGGRQGSRGSAPFGTYTVGDFTPGVVRSQQGYSYTRDAFPLSDPKDDAPGVGGGSRQGLLIHDASQSGNVTAGCIGIIGGGDTFERFKQDMILEQQKTGQPVKLALGPNGPQGDPSRPSVGMNKSRLPGDIASIVDYAARQTGQDPAFLQRVAEIESSGNPRNQTGSYKGLFQLSDGEFQKYGGGNIFNAADNAAAGAAKLADEKAQLARSIGRDPTPSEVYLAHQQGVAGAAAHLKNPDQPAWQSMASTAEGRAKGGAWSRQAIWGNLPPAARAKFGSVDNVTSGQFAQVWDNKINRRS